MVAAAIALAALTHRAIENPMRHAEWAAEPRRALALWPTALILVALTSWLGPLTAAPPVYAVSSARATNPGAAATGDSPTAVARTVEAAVKSTLAGEAVPAGLQPAIGQLAQDTFDTSCYTLSGQTQVKKCAAGDRAAGQSMLLFGDSHAGMWLPALDGIGRERHLALEYLIKNGCTPMTVHLWYANQGVQHDCDAWRDSAIEAIKASPADLVVLGSFAYRANLGDESGNNIPYARSLRVWQAGVSATIKAIARPGRKVVVLGDPQPMPALPVDCLSRPGATMSDCAGREDQGRFNWGQATADAAHQEQAAFVDVRPWFCWERVCPMVIGGRIAFLDQSHVSQSYLLTLQGVLAATLFPTS